MKGQREQIRTLIQSKDPSYAEFCNKKNENEYDFLTAVYELNFTEDDSIHGDLIKYFQKHYKTDPAELKNPDADVTTKLSDFAAKINIEELSEKFKLFFSYEKEMNITGNALQPTSGECKDVWIGDNKYLKLSLLAYLEIYAEKQLFSNFHNYLAQSTERKEAAAGEFGLFAAQQPAAPVSSEKPCCCTLF